MDTTKAKNEIIKFERYVEDLQKCEKINGQNTKTCTEGHTIKSENDFSFFKNSKAWEKFNKKKLQTIIDVKR